MELAAGPPGTSLQPGDRREKRRNQKKESRRRLRSLDQTFSPVQDQGSRPGPVGSCVFRPHTETRTMSRYKTPGITWKHLETPEMEQHQLMGAAFQTGTHQPVPGASGTFRQAPATQSGPV